MGLISTFTKSPLKAKFRRNFLIAWLGVLPLLSIMTTTILCVMFVSIPRPATVLDVAKAVGLIDSIKNFAAEYMVGILGGTDKKSLDGGQTFSSDDSTTKELLKKEMASPNELSLSTDPYSVARVTIESINSYQTDGPISQWEPTVKVVMQSPGISGYQTYRFAFDILDNNGTTTVLILPRLVNGSATLNIVSSGYTKDITQDARIKTQLKNFFTAYYVPSSNAAITGFATTSFKDAPISDSMCKSIELVSVKQATTDKVVADAAKANDKISVLSTVTCVTVKGIDGKNDTFINMQVPMTLQMSSNNQWLVDSIDKFVKIGDVTKK